MVIGWMAAMGAVFAAGAFAHGGNSDPNAIHACVNRVGEVRILGYMGYPAGSTASARRSVAPGRSCTGA